jgi:nitric oxide dioxygenase
LETQWENLRKSVSYQNGSILSRELRKDGKLNVTLFCMAKGPELSEHTSSKEGFIYVLDGDGAFTLEGNQIAMVPGVAIFMKKGAAHSLKAKENTAFVLVLG